MIEKFSYVVLLAALYGGSRISAADAQAASLIWRWAPLHDRVCEDTNCDNGIERNNRIVDRVCTIKLDALTSRICRGFEHRVAIARHTHAAFCRSSFDKGQTYGWLCTREDAS